jgi:signal recognition particle subunit SRP54
MAGLQGAGKTTTTAKLAKHLIEKRKKKVLTVSGDVYRPAAIEQLKTVTQQAGAEWFPSTPTRSRWTLRAPRWTTRASTTLTCCWSIPPAAWPLTSADARDQGPARRAEPGGNPVRGRCHAGPGRGQHGQGLQGALPLTGIILTKTDGDSRGGAALSVRQITGAPIKFAGVSEKIDGLEVFDAERHAGRILGMGDIVALVEQVTAGVDMEAAQKLAAKVKSGAAFDLNDFLARSSR